MPTPTYEGRPLPRPEEEVFDQGLGFDLQTLVDRRRLLKLMGYTGLSAVLLAAGCGSSSSGSGAGPSASAGSSAAAACGGGSGACLPFPEETAGPFPGDGSNGPDVLTQSGIVRSDIRSSFGELSGTADGVPLTIRLTILSVGDGCAPLAAAAVYVWHCDQAGQYSLYTVTDENYLRGVQEAGSDGVVTYTSILPACYPGRWPHVHFEVYSKLSAAGDDAGRIVTSQLALPEETCRAAYATPGYEQSLRTLSEITLASDMVFGNDGGDRQVGTVTGDATSGYTVALRVPVNA
jgi:protocatechuate 3,4-dioxygenase beta subunit